MDPFVSAIVLNYRTPKRTLRCVDALLRQTGRAQNLEILVVDNHSCDDSIGVFRNRLGKNPKVKLLETSSNRGFASGNALGAKAASGTYLLIVNPDTELEPWTLTTMVELLERDPSIGIVGPKLIHRDGTVRFSCRRFPRVTDGIIKRTPLRYILRKRLAHYLMLDRDLSRTADVDWLVGGCMLMRRSLFYELGGFDQRYFLFFEDIDLCRRAWEKGTRVCFVPEASALDEKHRLTEGSLLALFLTRRGRAHIVSALKYFWKWRGKEVPGYTMRCYARMEAKAHH